MRIVLISNSDNRGGAAVVTYRLMCALRDLGHRADMLVAHKDSDDPAVHVAGAAWRVKKDFIAEHLRILRACGYARRNLFKISIATDGLPLSRHPLVRQADAVLLGWVNQGLLSLDEIQRIAAEKPVVWTMHDMWNLTSLCHHAHDCRQYTQAPGCADCPLVVRKKLGSSTWSRKKKLYDAAGIRFVAVSTWLQRCSAQSSLMRGMKVECIPNAFPVDEFYIEPRRSRSSLGLPDGKRIILMGAARLDDPIKGLFYAINALNALPGNDAVAVFYGAIRNPDALAGLRFPHITLGPVDIATIRELCAHATVVMSTSLYETLPGTLIEGMAAGCTPVSFDKGGQCDIITNPQEGYLVPAYDTKKFAAALRGALDAPCNPLSQRAAVGDRFTATAIARRYVSLLR